MNKANGRSVEKTAQHLRLLESPPTPAYLLTYCIPLMTPISLIIAALCGALPFAIAFFGRRAEIALPKLKEIKAAYPAINSALHFAAEATDDHTIPGMVADAAFLFWKTYGQDPDGLHIDDERAKELTAAAVYHFNKQKYFDTDFSRLDPKAVEQGKEIAKRLFGSAIAEK